MPVSRSGKSRTRRRPLAKFAEAKPPTEAELRLAFPAVAKAVEKASEPITEGKPFVDRLWTRAQTS